MIVSAFNPSTENLEKSNLSSAYSAGVTSIDVRNNDRFTDDSRIMIGEMGAENTEIVTVDTVNANKTGITLATATKFPHSASDPVYLLTYDQIRFYRSVTTVDGSYTVQATVAIDVDNDDLKTRWDDTTGISSYFYKIAFYNSVASLESDLSDPIPGQGYSRKQVGTIVSDFLTEVGDVQQEYMTIPQIFSLLNECNEDIIGQSRRPYRFLSDKVTVSLEAGVDRIPLPDDIVKFDRLKYLDNDGVVQVVGNKQIVSIEEMEYYQYDENNVLPAVHQGIQFAAIDNTTNEIIVYPAPRTDQADAVTIYYWKEFDIINSLSDIVQTPVARIYKMFLLSRFYQIRAKKEDSFMMLSGQYRTEYSTEVVKLQRAQKIDVGTPMSFLPDPRTTRGTLRRR